VGIMHLKVGLNLSVDGKHDHDKEARDHSRFTQTNEIVHLMEVFTSGNAIVIVKRSVKQLRSDRNQTAEWKVNEQLMF
jgi:hypothetical protein